MHRYGVQLERKVEAIRLATEQANVIVSASPDDAGAMSLGTLRMAQERLFSLLRASDDGNLKEVTSAARAIADMARATVSVHTERRKVLAEARQEADEKLAAAEAELAGEKDPMDVIRRVRREIYGILDD